MGNFANAQHFVNASFYTEKNFIEIREKYQRIDSDNNKKNIEKFEFCRKFIDSPEKLLETYFLDLAKEFISTNYHLPAYVKYAIVSKVIKQFHYNNFVETGTFFGDTCLFFREKFKKLCTIDIDDSSYNHALKIYKNFLQIEPFLGDSGKILGNVIDKIKGNIIFWLDRHYTPINVDNSIGYKNLKSNDYGNTAIEQELKFIAKHKIKKHVILIDDVGCFENYNETLYPTIDYLKSLVKRLFPNHSFYIAYGIILILPQNTIIDLY